MDTQRVFPTHLIIQTLGIIGAVAGLVLWMITDASWPVWLTGVSVVAVVASQAVVKLREER